MKTVVLAISGGIDSMVLLDIMIGRQDLERIIVAHVDHGMRPDSEADRQFVEGVARGHGLEFCSVELQLGSAASEDLARKKRYEWLNQVVKKYQAEALITAHHQDDVIETIFINLLRGTGWRGLSSLRSHPKLYRPLLSQSKAELVEYAIVRDLQWREDSTNDSPKYLRNYIRLVLVPKLSSIKRQQLLSLYNEQLQLLIDIDKEADALLRLASHGQGLSRYYLMMLPPAVGLEIIRLWLRRSLTKRQGDRLYRFIATAKPGSMLELENGCQVQVTATELVV